MVQTVVIVDENLVCARLYRAMLEPLACRVLVARSAEEALDLVEPGWSPEEAVSDALADDATAADPAGPRRPLFLMAGLHPADQALRFARSGGAEAIFLRKPVAGDGLAALVRRHLSGVR